MNNLNLMFFGSISNNINSIALINALDNLALVSDEYAENREFCMDIYEVFEFLRYDLLDAGIKIGLMDYNEKKKEYKFPLMDSGNKIGLITIDHYGKVRVFYDKLRAMDLNGIDLEVKIKSLLDCSKYDLIDSVITMLQFARPISISSDVFLLSIKDEDKLNISNFFQDVFNYDKSSLLLNKPYFLTIENTEENREEIADLLVENINLVLKAFRETKDEYYEGFSDDLSYEDIEIIDNLIEFTKEDALYYEKELNQNIVERLIF